MNKYLPPERDLPPAALAIRRDHLVSEITKPARQRTSLRLGRRLTGIAGGIVLAGGGVGVAAASGMWSPHPPSPSALTSGCYAEADLDADTTIIDTAGGTDPVAACTRLWRAGVVKHDVHTAPVLVACVLHDGGTAGVFPGGPSTCKKLDLLPARPFTGPEQQQAVAFGKLKTELLALSGRCVSKHDAVAYTRKRLTALHITGWQVIVEDGGSTSQCAAFINFDQHRKAVLLR